MSDPTPSTIARSRHLPRKECREVRERCVPASLGTFSFSCSACQGCKCECACFMRERYCPNCGHVRFLFLAYSEHRSKLPGSFLKNSRPLVRLCTLLPAPSLRHYSSFKRDVPSPQRLNLLRIIRWWLVTSAERGENRMPGTWNHRASRSNPIIKFGYMGAGKTAFGKLRQDLLVSRLRVGKMFVKRVIWANAST